MTLVALPKRDTAAATIGAWIRQLRLERGMTQRELGDACGMSQPNVTRLECGAIDRRYDGKYLPSLRTLMRVAKALDVRVSTIVAALDGAS